MISLFLAVPWEGGGQGRRNDKSLLQWGNPEPLSYPGPSQEEEENIQQRALAAL